LRLARSREVSVQGSIHKKIIFAGFGCAGVIVALMVVALVLVPRSELEQPGDPALYAAEQAVSARDSLAALRPGFAAPRGRAADQTGAAFWKAALSVMRAERPEAGFRVLPYGDTFPPAASQRGEWIASARWSAVRIVLGQPAAHGQPTDTVPQSFRVDATLILALSRALHARARVALDSPSQPAVAASAERAALSMGRGLETEPDLEHVLLGARVVRDARQFLATVPALARRIAVLDSGGALAQADSDLAELRAARRLMGMAGSRADNCVELDAWARDGAIGVATRREAVRAIAYGWVFNRLEPVYGLNRERARSLEALAALDLPAPIAAAVREGQAVQRLGVAQRLARSFEYRMTRDAAAGF
jgi:hypothetical protein